MKEPTFETRHGVFKCFVKFVFGFRKVMVVVQRRGLLPMAWFFTQLYWFWITVGYLVFILSGSVIFALTMFLPISLAELFVAIILSKCVVAVGHCGGGTKSNCADMCPVVGNAIGKVAVVAMVIEAPKDLQIDRKSYQPGTGVFGKLFTRIGNGVCKGLKCCAPVDGLGGGRHPKGAVSINHFTFAMFSPVRWTHEKFNTVWVDMTELFFVSPLVFFGTLVALRVYSGMDTSAQTGTLIGAVYSAVFEVFSTLHFRLPAFDMPCTDFECWKEMVLSVLSEFPSLDWGPENFIKSAKSYVALNLLASIFKTAVTIFSVILSFIGWTNPGVPVAHAAPKALMLKMPFMEKIFNKYFRPLAQKIKIEAKDVFDGDEEMFSGGLFGGDDEDEYEDDGEAAPTQREEILNPAHARTDL
jgi:hypothetical protein